MEKPSLLVSEFDKTLISLLIREAFGAEFPDISQKRQIQYLYNYLTRLGAKTVVCETSYIDKDYLMDYQKYYVRCFNGYSTKCARLHFFDEEFSYKDLIEAVGEDSPNTSKYTGSYLGFTVIKPLPVTFLGKTCLKHYEDSGDKQRNYISRLYKSHLLGISFELNSTAYQEQDKVVSACATTALWSLMHATEHLAISTIPSPSEITLNAISGESSCINGFPNEGLSDSQVIRTLESSNLKLHEFKVDSEDGISVPDLNMHIRDHVESNIPIFAGVSVFTKNTSGTYEFEGDHAVTILGYKHDSSKDLCALYIHDDRIGPYVKAVKKSEPITIEFNKNNENRTEDIKEYYSIDIDNLEPNISEIIVLRTLKTASYYKVRIPYSLILAACKSLESTIIEILKVHCLIKGKADYQVEFKIQLLDSNKAKDYYLKSSCFKNKTEILLKSWPKYIWKSSFTLGKSHLFDLIYDATDIPLGKGLIHIIKTKSLNTDLVLGKLEEVYSSEERQARDPSNIELSFFYSTMRELLHKKTMSYSNKLEVLFGPPAFTKEN